MAAAPVRSQRPADTNPPGGLRLDQEDNKSLGTLKREIHQICNREEVAIIQHESEENGRLFLVLSNKLREMAHPFAKDLQNPNCHELDGMYQWRSIACLQRQYIHRMHTVKHIVTQNYLEIQSIPRVRNLFKAVLAVVQSTDESYRALFKMQQTAEEQYQARVSVLLQIAPNLYVAPPSNHGGPQVEQAPLQDITHEISQMVKEMDPAQHLLKARQHKEVAKRWDPKYKDLEADHPFASRPAGPQDLPIVTEIEELDRNIFLASLEMQYVHRIQTLRFIADHHRSSAKTAAFAQTVFESLQASRAIIDSNHADLLEKMKQSDRLYDTGIQELFRELPSRLEHDENWRLFSGGHRQGSDCVVQ